MESFDDKKLREVLNRHIAESSDALVAHNWLKVREQLAPSFSMSQGIHVCVGALLIGSAYVLYRLHPEDAFPLIWTVCALPLGSVLVLFGARRRLPVIDNTWHSPAKPSNVLTEETMELCVPNIGPIVESDPKQPPNIIHKEIWVPFDVIGLQLNTSRSNLEVGDTMSLEAIGWFIYGMSQIVTGQAQWTSHNESVAVVDRFGVVKGQAVGTAIIEARWKGETETVEIRIDAIQGDEAP